MKHGLERPTPTGRIGMRNTWCASSPAKNCRNKTAMSDPQAEGVSFVLNERGRYDSVRIAGSLIDLGLVSWLLFAMKCPRGYGSMGRISAGDNGRKDLLSFDYDCEIWAPLGLVMGNAFFATSPYSWLLVHLPPAHPVAAQRDARFPYSRFYGQVDWICKQWPTHY